MVRNWLAICHMGAESKKGIINSSAAGFVEPSPAQSLHPHPSKRLQSKKNQSAADILHWRPHPRQIYALLTPFLFFIWHQNHIHLRGKSLPKYGCFFLEKNQTTFFPPPPPRVKILFWGFFVSMH